MPQTRALHRSAIPASLASASRPNPALALTICASLWAAEPSSAQFVDIGAGLEDLSGVHAAWGDYDNDGDLDVLTTGVNESELPVSHLYRNDAGSFVDIAAGLPGMYEGSVAWGDYDNDGDLDILFAGATDGFVRVSRVYRNDAGSFTDALAGLAGSSGAASWVDYDSDGDLDLLLLGDGGGVPATRFYRNDAGAFSGPLGAGLPAEWALPQRVAWGDYDNDGDPDLLISEFSAGGPTRVYRNDAGTFTDINAGLQDLGFPGVAWGDYDNDGDLDILLAGQIASAGAMKIYRNDGSVFSDIGAAFAGSPLGVGCEWGDYDNDGDLDIVVTGRGAFSDPHATRIYRNDGAGVFTDVSAGLPNAAGIARWGDYDGDGDLDLLVEGDTGSFPLDFVTRIYRNQSGVANTVPTPPATLSAVIDSFDLVATFTWSGGSDSQTPAAGLSYNLRLGTTPGGVELMAPMADVPGGHRRIPGLGNAQQAQSRPVDISAVVPGTTIYWSVQSVDGAWAGGPFSSEHSVPVEGLRDVQAGLTAVNVAALAWGDYDNDGDSDLLVAGDEAPFVSSVRLYRNDAGTFTDVGAGLPGLSLASLDWGDYDNDGGLDILLTGYNPLMGSLHSRVYRNDGGSFSDINAGLVGVFAGAGSWADYDNDGDPDALISGIDEFGTAGTRIYRNDAGSFIDSNAGLPGWVYTEVSWADYDNDGDLDLLLAGLQSASGPSVTKLFRNDAGSFTDSGIAFADVWQASMSWADYDSDGDPDLLLSGNSYSELWSATKLYRNDGGAFTDVGLAVPQGARALGWGDYDNDGDPDILLAAVNTSIYLNDGGSFTELQVGLPYLATATVAWGDFDADGDLDLALAGDTGSELLARIYENHAAPANSPPAPPSNLALSEVGGIATFSWSAGSDAETPTSGLSYNLRVGTTPGGSEVMSAMADGATGYRREPGLGNAQQRLSWSLDVSAFGSETLYWSVQTIDASYAGSEFAPEQGPSTDVHDLSPLTQDHLALHANAPNPFRSGTAIRFDLPQSGLVDLAVYDVAGRRVGTLAKGTYPAGSHELTWHGVDDNGRLVAAGVYFCRLRMGPRVETRWMTLLR